MERKDEKILGLLNEYQIITTKMDGYAERLNQQSRQILEQKTCHIREKDELIEHLSTKENQLKKFKELYQRKEEELKAINEDMNKRMHESNTLCRRLQEEIGTKDKHTNVLQNENEELLLKVESLQHSLELYCAENNRLKHESKVQKEQGTIEPNKVTEDKNTMQNDMTLLKQEFQKLLKKTEEQTKRQEDRLDRMERKKEIEERNIGLQERGNEIATRYKNLAEREKQLDSREKKAKEMEFERREDDINRKERMLKQREQLGSVNGYSAVVAKGGSTLRFHNNSLESEEMSSDDEHVPIPRYKRLEKKNLAQNKYNKDNKKYINREKNTDKNKLNKTNNREELNSRSNKQNSSVQVDEHDSTILNESKNVIIFSSSITKGIHAPRLNDRYESGHLRFQRFHGAKARHMETYLSPVMFEELPDTVVIQAGGNDLKAKPGKKLIPPVMVANSLIDAGLACKQFSTQHVLIGGVTVRKSEFEKKRAAEINEALEGQCKLNNFNFINNSAIREEHLYDGIHLNKDGSKILADNYLQALWEVRSANST